ARGRWYNPTSGVYTDITGGAYTLANSGTRAFTTPGNNGTGTNDWVLVLDTGTPTPPVASFGASATSGTAPLSINFVNSSSGTITSYAWTFGDGVTSNAQNPVHVYSSAGVYTVSLQVVGPLGSNTQTRTNYITVSAPASDTTPPTAPSALGASAASSSAINLFWNGATDNVGVTGYRVERCQGVGCGSFTQIGTSAWTSFADSGLTSGTSYSYRVRATDAAGNLGAYSNTASATTAGGPVAQFSAATTSGVAPLTVTFTNASSGAITSYAWTFGDGTTSTVASPSHVYSAAGVYTVALTVTGPGGSNTQTRSGYITVTSATPVAQFSAATTSGVAPLTVNFTNASSGTITSYAWTFGDGTTSTVATPSHVYSAAGVYTVALTVTGPGGSNTQTRTNYVTVAAAGGDTTPPTAPSSLGAGATGAGAISLFWNRATDNVGVTDYRIERCQGAGCASFTQIGTSAWTSFADAGLTPGTTYGYRVRATDAAGNLGAYSNTASATTAVASSIAFVQLNYATPQSAQSPVNITFTSAQTAGNLNVVVVGWGDATAVVTSVTDSKGNVYARAVGPTTMAGPLNQSIYFAKNIAAAAANANTVTVRFNVPAQYPDIRVVEYSGIDKISPVDVTAAGTGSAALASTPPVSTTNANDLLFGASSVWTHNTGPGAGFTSRVITAPNGDIVEDRVVSVAGSYSATAPMTSGNWIMQMVAFRAGP
ncbi:MAG: PKD domain-containing protein, partial [Casimicrobiaceae bacterium]